MDRKVIIKVLGYLEKKFPDKCDISSISNNLKIRSDRELMTTLLYLGKSGKIDLYYKRSTKKDEKRLDSLVGKDEISITYKGMDYLTEIKSTESRENMDNTIKFATIIIALSALCEYILSVDKLISGSDPISFSFSLFGVIVISIIILIALSKMTNLFLDGLKK